MILSDAGIRLALKKKEIELDPLPDPDHYQTSAVDILLEDKFRVWNLDQLKETPGVTTHVNLAKQDFGLTASKYTKELHPNANGFIEIPPYEKTSQVPLSDQVPLGSQSKVEIGGAG